MKPSTSKTLSLSQAQTQLKVVEADLKNAITRHATYIDKTGKASTGSKGLAIQINIRTQKTFCDNRETFNDKQLRYLIIMQQDLIELIASGEAKGLSRAEIKKILYATIDDYGSLVRRAAA